MNSWQQPASAEPGGATWHKVENPGTGWFASKASGWTADSFSGGLTVNFSSVVPVGTRAIRVAMYREGGVAGSVSSRKGGDSNISNTPYISQEYSTFLLTEQDIYTTTQAVIWLSATYTADFAVENVNEDLYIPFPSEYLL